MQCTARVAEDTLPQAGGHRNPCQAATVGAQNEHAGTTGAVAAAACHNGNDTMGGGLMPIACALLAAPCRLRPWLRLLALLFPLLLLLLLVALLLVLVLVLLLLLLLLEPPVLDLLDLVLAFVPPDPLLPLDAGSSASASPSTSCSFVSSSYTNGSPATSLSTLRSAAATTGCSSSLSL